MDRPREATGRTRRCQRETSGEAGPATKASSVEGTAQNAWAVLSGLDSHALRVFSSFFFGAQGCLPHPEEDLTSVLGRFGQWRSGLFVGSHGCAGQRGRIAFVSRSEPIQGWNPRLLNHHRVRPWVEKSSNRSRSLHGLYSVPLASHRRERHPLLRQGYRDPVESEGMWS